MSAECNNVVHPHCSLLLYYCYGEGRVYAKAFFTVCSLALCLQEFNLFVCVKQPNKCHVCTSLQKKASWVLNNILLSCFLRNSSFFVDTILTSFSYFLYEILLLFMKQKDVDGSFGSEQKNGGQWSLPSRSLCTWFWLRDHVRPYIFCLCYRICDIAKYYMVSTYFGIWRVESIKS